MYLLGLFLIPKLVEITDQSVRVANYNYNEIASTVNIRENNSNHIKNNRTQPTSDI